MNHREILQALLDGKKVRSIYWENPKEFIYLDGDGVIYLRSTSKFVWNLGLDSTFEIYTPPVKKVKGKEAFELLIQGKVLHLNSDKWQLYSNSFHEKYITNTLAEKLLNGTEFEYREE